MARATTSKKTELSYEVFSQNQGNIIIPEFPYPVRNNCQVGQWTDGSKELGTEAALTIIKFSKFFGSLGQTENSLWGQLWMVCESGCLPQGIILCTYIKSQGLRNFIKTVAQVQAAKMNPAEGIFIPRFTKQQSPITDDNGEQKLANYYVLEWEWQERPQELFNTIEELNQIMESNENRKKLIDLEGTKEMICIDGLEVEQVYNLIENQTLPAIPAMN